MLRGQPVQRLHDNPGGWFGFWHPVTSLASNPAGLPGGWFGF